MRFKFALAIAGFCVLGAGNAQASGFISVSCNGTVSTNTFFGPQSVAIVCALNGGGTATVKADQTDAGLNHFLDGISVHYDTSGVPQLTLNSVDIVVDSFPTWTDPPPPLVPTLLALTGRAQIPDPTGSLELDLTGDLGGPIQEIDPTLTPANCAQCTLNIINLGMQARDPIAEEELFISSVGRTAYNTDSPTFAGAIPEASTWVMMILGFAGLGVMAFRRNSVSAFT